MHKFNANSAAFTSTGGYFSSPPSTSSSLRSPIAPPLSARERYEAARSFDELDDLEFCPCLTNDEVMSITSSAYSSSSSTGSTSPGGSPPQSQAYTTTSVFSNVGNGNGWNGRGGQRVGAARGVAIVDPITGMRVATPPRNQYARRSYW